MREIRFALRTLYKAKRSLSSAEAYAGMEAARVAALRGHTVELFEKNAALGGEILYLAERMHSNRKSVI